MCDKSVACASFTTCFVSVYDLTCGMAVEMTATRGERKIRFQFQLNYHQLLLNCVEEVTAAFLVVK